MSLKFFIPGGAGYIGSVLVELALKKGHHVTVLDNFFYKQSSLLHLIREKNLEISQKVSNSSQPESSETHSDISTKN